MTIEERLKEMRDLYSDVFDTASNMIEQYEAIHSLATQLAGVLREIPVPMHTCPGPMTRRCTCGLAEWEKRRDAILNGGDDDHE